MARDAGSFRDPSGHVHVVDQRVLRSVRPAGRADYEFVRDTGLLAELAAEGLVVGAREVDAAELSVEAPDAVYVLEHPRLPVISHPYEWSFHGLRDAALLQLDVHLRALDQGVTLADASAYNITFDGPRPIFFDYLSFRRYTEGEFWMGHRQFCEQFLNPLLLTAFTGVPYHAWYRGAMEGIPSSHLAPLVPKRRRLSWRVLTHVMLQAGMQKPNRSGSGEKVSQMKLPLAGYQRMLRSMRRWINGLEPSRRRPAIWTDYESTHSYDEESVAAKHGFVSSFVQSERPELLVDVGCNAGEYSRVAIAAGASSVVGLESDHGALDAAFARAKSEALPFLPLHADAANPSPAQGWAGVERPSLTDRLNANGVLALAVLHHIAIARNVPLDQAVAWLMALAPAGVIEFVPKSDPMVQQLLRLRKDIFDTYDEGHFIAHVEAHGQVVSRLKLGTGGRLLVRYRRS